MEHQPHPPLNIVVPQDEPSAVTEEGAAGWSGWERLGFEQCVPQPTAGGESLPRRKLTTTAAPTGDGLRPQFISASESKDESELVYESKVTRVFRVVETAGECEAGAEALLPRVVAIKTLFGINQSSSGANAELLNEYNILKEHLASCPSARSAISHGPIGGSPFALYLRWLDGQTLREWTRANPVPPIVSTNSNGVTHRRGINPTWAARGLPRYVNAMKAAAEALADVHEAGVGHGNVSLDNIIILDNPSTRLGHPHSLLERDESDSSNVRDELSEGEEHDLPLKAVFIDFGRSFSVRNEKGTSDNASLLVKDPRMFRDLRMMGLMFLEMLHGETEGRGNTTVSLDESSTSIPSTTSGKMMCDATIMIESCRLFVPASVLNIVDGLLGSLDSFNSNQSSIKGRYITAREVEQQLREISCTLTESATKAIDGKFLKSPFQFDSGHLFGRDREVSEVMAAYQRRLGSSPSKPSDPEVIFLEGYSGTGKSALAEQIRAPVAADSGFYISGKFDLLCHAEPYAALSSAFVELCDQISAMDERDIAEMRETILGAIGSSWRLLAGVIPNLNCIMSGDSLSSSGSSGGEYDKGIEYSIESFLFVFQMFVRAVCKYGRPILMFVDDMQWADAPSLCLLKVLLTDPDIVSSGAFMFIGAYRSNEVKANDPLSVQLNEIEICGTTVTRIQVGDLTEDVVNDMISSALDLPQDRCQSLAGIVHKKTNGNVFYTIELLRSLCDEGLLHFSIDQLAWDWDEYAIEAKGIANNVVGLLSSKILKLPKPVQAVMKVASCIGAQFDEETMLLVAKSSGDKGLSCSRPWAESLREVGQTANSISDALRVLAEEGLMYKLASSRFKFAHDRVQQAAYSLIPIGDKSVWHYGIGSAIRQNAPPKELDSIIFTVVDQMNRGVKEARDAAEQIDLARLNLRAGKKALSSCAHVPAASYLRAGVNLLKVDECWENEYELSLEIHNAYATAAYCNGNFDQMDDIIDSNIFCHSRSLFDTCTGTLLIIKALAARNKSHDAIAMGFGFLAQLGEPFPNTVSKKVLVSELLKTKWVLRRKSDACISSLPAMTNETKIIAMKVLGDLIEIVYTSKVDMLPLIILRMVRLSVKYGTCGGPCSYAFALYGAILCGALGDINRGCRYGQVALSLLERSKSSEWYAKVYLVVYGLVLHWKEPIKTCFEPLLKGYEKGMKAGDVNTATSIVHAHCAYHVHLGYPLEPTEALFRKYHQVLTKHNQEMFLPLHLLFWQAILNLMGRSSNPTELTGEVMNQTDFIRDAIENNKSMEMAFMYYNRMLLAFLFGEYALAAEMGENNRNIGAFALSNFVVTQQIFYEGLNAAVLYNQTKVSKWRKLARANRKVLKKWNCCSSGNRTHMIMLLKAELSCSKGNAEETELLYDSAIREAGKSGFLLDEAIANERAAVYFVDNNGESRSRLYLSQALKCYVEFGAQAKVDHLVSQVHFSSLIETTGNTK